MSVLRRLVNVAYGKVRVWQRGDPFDADHEGPADADGDVARAGAPDVARDDERAPSAARAADGEASAGPRVRRL